MNIPQLVAHRGYMERYPENSLRGIEAALQCGAPCVEFDIQSTADGTLVVFHDVELQRTCGRSGNLLQLQSADLAGISCHEPDRLGERFMPTPIPTLREMCALMRRYPATRAFVEIKQESLDRFGIGHILTATLEAIEVIRHQCVIISYNMELLLQARSVGKYPIGWVLEQYSEKEQRIAEDIQPEYLIIGEDLFPSGSPLWNGPWEWMLYDITDPARALAYAESGIGLIETRNIGTMLRHPLLQQLRQD